MGNRKKAKGAERKAKSQDLQSRRKFVFDLFERLGERMGAACIEMSTTLTDEEYDVIYDHVNHFSKPSKEFDESCFKTMVITLRERGPDYLNAKLARRRCVACGRCASLDEPAYLVCAGCCTPHYCDLDCQQEDWARGHKYGCTMCAGAYLFRLQKKKQAERMRASGDAEGFLDAEREFAGMRDVLAKMLKKSYAWKARVPKYDTAPAELDEYLRSAEYNTKY